jgi:DMSO reductase anchor subunit
MMRMLFIILITLPITLGLSFGLYRFCLARAIPSHLSVLVGAIALLPGMALGTWLFFLLS